MAENNVYYGSEYPLDSDQGDLFIGYRTPAGTLGATTGVQTANQVKEVTNLLNQGISNVEVSVINPEIMEMIGKDHLKEIHRVSELTGSETSLHAPVVDPSGFTQQGWDETNRVVAENQFKDVVERAYDLNPEGNTPVTIHSSSVPGTEHIPIKDPETGKMVEVEQKKIVVNRDNGQLIPLLREEKYYPDSIAATGEPELRTTDQQLRTANNSQWINDIENFANMAKTTDEVIGRNLIKLANVVQAQDMGQPLSPEQLNKDEFNALQQLQKADVFVQSAESNFNTLFEKAYKYAKEDNDKENLKKLNEVAKVWSNGVRKINEDALKGGYGKGIVRDGQLLAVAPKEGKEVIFETGTIQSKQQLLFKALQGLKNVDAPQFFKPVEEFVNEKASETLSSAAFHGYKKFKENAPIVSIENPPYGSAVSRAEDLKDLVQESRKKFVQMAVKDGMSESAAKKAAEKTIGVTWDTSHISMLRKQGFKADKLVEEAEKIAPFVKHVHLNDNFGSTHTDLPPGMGSVPIKEILEKFGKAGFKGKKVFEGGNFFQHFQQSPHPMVLEGLGSPLGTEGGAPYWNQIIDSTGNYSAGIGKIFPEQHFNLYGSGFSTLPVELGGQVQGGQSRFSGTPNA